MLSTMHCRQEKQQAQYSTLHSSKSQPLSARSSQRNSVVPFPPPQKVQTPHACDKDVLLSHGFKLGQRLGSGSYSKVRLAVSSEDSSKYVAIKIIDRRRAPQDYQKKFLPRELAIVKILQHPYIIKTHDVFEQNYKIYMVLEFAENGDVLEYVRCRSQGPVGESLARKWILQTTHALLYLHTRGIAHRDIKCENLLLTTENNIRLSDFGFVRRVAGGELSKTYCGSAAYAAPEIIRSLPYNPFLADSWALGVVLFIIITGLMPFGDDVKNVAKILQAQISGVQFPQDVTRKVSSNCQDLIRGMLKIVPVQRFTINRILIDKWMSSV